MVTRPVALPGSDPIREIGSILRVSGARGAPTVILACLLTPLKVTGIVPRVAPPTPAAAPGADAAQAPGGPLKAAGPLTAGESLERLSRAPPAGAGPSRSTQAVTGEPPLTATGVT